jgi:acyl-CoA hydrolase
MQVDLLGQCASESLGTHYMSSTGGQADFMRGAQLSAGGQSFIVTHATAHDTASGTTVSRIVSTLSDGAVVTAHKNLVDKVVTEHGVAELTGRTAAERARALIAVAAPACRDELGRAAHERGLLWD